MELILMAHQTSSAPLVYSNGAPATDTPLEFELLMAHQAQSAPLVSRSFLFELARLSKHTNGASVRSAPLLVVTSNGAPAVKCAINVLFLLYFLFFFFCKATNGALIGSAPLLD